MESKPVQHSQHTSQKPEVDLSRILSENSEIIDDLKDGLFDNITNIFASRSEPKSLKDRVSEEPTLKSTSKTDKAFKQFQQHKRQV
jgi:hypothetical protein